MKDRVTQAVDAAEKVLSEALSNKGGTTGKARKLEAIASQAKEYHEIALPQQKKLWEIVAAERAQKLNVYMAYGFSRVEAFHLLLVEVGADCKPTPEATDGR